MKIMAVFVIFISVACAEIWRDKFILKNGFSKNIVCKNGYLMSVITKKDGNVTQKIEQQYCYDISVWDGNCMHPPIKCKENKR